MLPSMTTLNETPTYLCTVNKLALNFINDLEPNQLTLKIKVSLNEMFIYTIQIYQLGKFMTENYRESEKKKYSKGIKITKTIYFMQIRIYFKSYMYVYLYQRQRRDTK